MLPQLTKHIASVVQFSCIEALVQKGSMRQTSFFHPTQAMRYAGACTTLYNTFRLGLLDLLSV
jgi:hypothetical protein